jgi:ADP-ribose pyrophosphatase
MEHSGYLIKSPLRGHMLSRSRRRFLALRGETLEWSAEENSEVLGCVNVRGAQVERRSAELIVKLGAGGHRGDRLVLRGDGLDGWAQALRTASRSEHGSSSGERNASRSEPRGGSSTQDSSTSLAPPCKSARSEPPPPPLHFTARSKHPLYPERSNVPDAAVPWSVKWDDYAPVEYTAQVVFDFDCSVRPNGWADPKDPTALGPDAWRARFSNEGELVFEANGRPRNPRGRTGMSTRGLLGKWGPNHAADPIVTRFDPARPRKLQMVAVRRRDTPGIWAIPGGMVDAGETVSVTVRREFTEEAGNLEGEAAEMFTRLTDELFANGEVVYRGYVDDPRNTDHAWMETTAFHFHCSPELGAMLPLGSGDDAADVAWLDVDADEPRYANLYADHKKFVDHVMKTMGERSSTAPRAASRSHDTSQTGGEAVELS